MNAARLNDPRIWIPIAALAIAAGFALYNHLTEEDLAAEKLPTATSALASGAAENETLAAAVSAWLASDGPSDAGTDARVRAR